MSVTWSRSSGPQSSGPKSSGPRSSGPQSSGPQSSGRAVGRSGHVSLALAVCAIVVCAVSLVLFCSVAGSSTLKQWKYSKYIFV